MTSSVTQEFRQRLARLPAATQEQAARAYALWRWALPQQSPVQAGQPAAADLLRPCRSRLPGTRATRRGASLLVLDWPTRHMTSYSGGCSGDGLTRRCRGRSLTLAPLSLCVRRPERTIFVLKELGKADWLRMLNIPVAHIPTVLILRGTRNLQAQCETARGFFANVREVGAQNGLIEYVLIGELMGRLVGFACVYDAPMASEIVHIFGVLGTRAVIQTGNWGHWDGPVAGDLFVPAAAFCGEGAAQYDKSDGQ